MSGFGQPLHNLKLNEDESCCSGLQLQRERKSRHLINLLRQISDAEPGKHIVTRRRRQSEELYQLEGWDISTLVKKSAPVTAKRSKRKINRLVQSEPHLKRQKVKLPDLSKPKSMDNIKKKVIATSSRAPSKSDYAIRQLEYAKCRQRFQKSSFLKVDSWPVRPMVKPPLARGKKGKNKLKMDELANSYAKSVDKFKSSLKKETSPDPVSVLNKLKSSIKKATVKTSPEPALNKLKSSMKKEPVQTSPDPMLNKLKSAMKKEPVKTSPEPALNKLKSAMKKEPPVREKSPVAPLENNSKQQSVTSSSTLSQDTHNDGDRVLKYCKSTHPKHPSKSPYLKAAEFQKSWPLKPRSKPLPPVETEEKPDKYKLNMAELADAYAKSRDKFKSRFNEMLKKEEDQQHVGDGTDSEIVKDTEYNTVQPFKPMPKKLPSLTQQGEVKNKKLVVPKKKKSIVLPDRTTVPLPRFQVQGSILKVQKKKKKSERPTKTRSCLIELDPSTVAIKKKKPKKVKSEQVKTKGADKKGWVGMMHSIKAPQKPLLTFPNRSEQIKTKRVDKKGSIGMMHCIKAPEKPLPPFPNRCEQVKTKGADKKVGMMQSIKAPEKPLMSFPDHSEQVKTKGVDEKGSIGMMHCIKAPEKPLLSFPDRYEALPQIKKQTSRSAKKKLYLDQGEEPNWNSTAREAVAELAGDYLFKAWMVDQEFSTKVYPGIARMLRHSANKLL